MLKAQYIRKTALLGFVALLGAFSMGGAAAMSLRDAIAVAITSNPEIGQAIENREAIEFELRQARGLFMPRIDMENSVGVRQLDNPTRRATGRAGDTLKPAEAGLVATWKLFDGYGRNAEVERQASRVDGASFRVLERTEFISLQVTKEYMETLLQMRLVRLAEENVANLRSVNNRIRSAESSGTLTVADRRQGEERLAAASARLVEARQELAAAQIRFLRVVGMAIKNPAPPPAIAGRLPRSIDLALGVAVKNNPRIKMADADIDAASALVKAAQAKLYPEVFAEGRARTGRDIDGFAGRTNDAQARLVMRWNLYNGGIDRAAIQEQARRVAEARHARDTVLREIQEAVRISWDRRMKQSELVGILARQSGLSDQVVSSYFEQFDVGKRSLLDVLDAQNTRYNTKVLLETARSSQQFAEYRVLAATGQLVAALGLKAPNQADAYARERANVPPSSLTETLPRYSPPRSDTGKIPSGPL